MPATLTTARQIPCALDLRILTLPSRKAAECLLGTSFFVQAQYTILTLPHLPQPLPNVIYDYCKGAHRARPKQCIRPYHASACHKPIIHMSPIYCATVHAPKDNTVYVAYSTIVRILLMRPRNSRGGPAPQICFAWDSVENGSEHVHYRFV
jgi:hypothetical protein